MLNGLISFIFAFIIFFTPFAFGTVHLWSVTALECSVLLLLFLHALKTIKNGRFEYRQNPLNLCFLLFILYIGFQLVFRITKNPYLTFSGLKSSILYFALFFVVLNTIETKREIDRVIFRIILAGFLVSLFALVQYFSGTEKIYWVKKLEQRVFFGPFINQNHFASYISVISLVTLGAIFANTYVAEKYETCFSLKRRILYAFESLFNNRSFLLIFAIAIMVISLFLSGSRGGVFFFLAGASFFIASLVLRKRAKKTVFFALAAGFIFLLLMISWASVEKSAEELATILDLTTVLDRVRVYEEAAGLFRRYPVFGIGVGAFSTVFPMYRSGVNMTFYPHLHNEFFQLLVEAGICGFILVSIPFLVFLFSIFPAIGKTRSMYKYYTALGILSAFFYLGLDSMINFSLRLNAISALFVILLAVSLLVINFRPRPDRISEIDMPAKRLFAIKSAGLKPLFYLFSGAVFTCALFVIASPLIARALADNAKNLPSFEKAIRFDPRNDGLYSDYHDFILTRCDLGLIEEGAAYEKAEKAIDRAISLNPYKSDYIIVKGEFEVRRKNYEKAASLIREASMMEPSNHQLRLVYAYVLFQEGLNERDPKKKGALLKKGLIEYNMAKFLCNHVNFHTTIKDRKTLGKFMEALRKEEININ